MRPNKVFDKCFYDETMIAESVAVSWLQKEKSKEKENTCSCKAGVSNTQGHIVQNIRICRYISELMSTDCANPALISLDDGTESSAVKQTPRKGEDK